MATTMKAVDAAMIRSCSKIASSVVNLPTRSMWIDYDKEADVLYMSFRKPQHASKTVEAGEDILVRKDGRTIVGLTIMNASCH